MEKKCEQAGRLRKNKKVDSGSSDLRGLSRNVPHIAASLSNLEAKTVPATTIVVALYRRYRPNLPK